MNPCKLVVWIFPLTKAQSHIQSWELWGSILLTSVQEKKQPHKVQKNWVVSVKETWKFLLIRATKESTKRKLFPLSRTSILEKKRGVASNFGQFIPRTKQQLIKDSGLEMVCNLKLKQKNRGLFKSWCGEVAWKWAVRNLTAGHASNTVGAWKGGWLTKDLDSTEVVLCAWLKSQ